MNGLPSASESDGALYGAKHAKGALPSRKEHDMRRQQLAPRRQWHRQQLAPPTNGANGLRRAANALDCSETTNARARQLRAGQT